MPYRVSPVQITIFLAVLWSALIGAAFAWNVAEIRQHTREIAMDEAAISWKRDINFRRWVAEHGGVYVPVDDRTRPNPYLEVPEREIATPSGKTLTLMNPAYAMREVYEFAGADSGLRGHITSLRPIRPGNSPDPWEREALAAFERGKKELFEIRDLNGAQYARFMSPFIVEKGCLKCHAQQGYREGDVRGGISVSIPMAPLLKIERKKLVGKSVIFLILWAGGMGGLFYAMSRLSSVEKLRRVAEDALQANQQRLEENVRERTKELTAANEEIGRFNEKLEDLIATRTAELKESNGNLAKAHRDLTERAGELVRQNERVMLLSEMGDFLQSCQSVEEAAKLVAGSAPRLLPGHSGAIYLFGDSRQTVSTIASWGDVPPEVETFDSSECWALRRGKMHVVHDSRIGTVCPHMEKAVELRGSSERYICIPLQAQSEILGLIHFHSIINEKDPEDDKSVADVQNLITNFSGQVSLAFANLRLRDKLKEQTIHDPLTGLFNRRYLEVVLNQEISRAYRNGKTFGVIMIDVDHFKAINDRYGHEYGDKVLKEIGSYLVRKIRGDDAACRFGGEEFAVVMIDLTLESLKSRAEVFRAGVSQLVIPTDDPEDLAVTISAGVALYPEHGRNMDELLKAADEALYRAKAGGRNRVEAAGKPHA